MNWERTIAAVIAAISMALGGSAKWSASTQCEDTVRVLTQVAAQYAHELKEHEDGHE